MAEHGAYEAATQRHDEVEQRLVWTGAAANGAFILALTNVVANASDFAATTIDLLWSFSFSGAGFVCGAIAIGVASDLYAVRRREAVAQARLQIANRDLHALRDVLMQGAMPDGLADLMTTDHELQEAVKALRYQLLQTAMHAAEEAPGIAEKALAELNELATEGGAIAGRSRGWLVGSLLLAAASVLAFVLHPWISILLRV